MQRYCFYSDYRVFFNFIYCLTTISVTKMLGHDKKKHYLCTLTITFNLMKAKLVEKKYLVTFILVTSLFALWGFANDITNPMVAAFQTLMELTAA